MKLSIACAFGSALAVLLLGVSAPAMDLQVRTDFEGGSVRVESIDQASRVIRFMPGGDPERGWPCWWYLRVDGVARGERLTLDLAGSDLPVRNQGQSTSKPLAASWAMPSRAAFSTDGRTWRQTEPGQRAGDRTRYEVVGDGGPVRVAWGPPFTPRDTDELLEQAGKARPAATSFELARTRAGRPVRGVRVSEAASPAPPAIWVQARQHAWESGSSWVARGFVEWLLGDDPDARWLRRHAEIFVVPIMDVDNAATGNGGKEANPRDHNRDWDDQPVYPEVAAAQDRLRELAKSGRCDLFLDLHDPAPDDAQPFFFVGPPELLPEPARSLRSRFLELAGSRISGPLVLDKKPRVTGPAYHPLWRQISGQWVTEHGNRHTVAACLETSWNTPQSTTEDYRRVGRQLGQAIADYMRGKASDG
jgi:hypothetical protein